MDDISELEDLHDKIAFGFENLKKKMLELNTVFDDADIDIKIDVSSLIAIRNKALSEIDERIDKARQEAINGSHVEVG